jgi:hypothetical protein
VAALKFYYSSQGQQVVVEESRRSPASLPHGASTLSCAAWAKDGEALHLRGYRRKGRRASTDRWRLLAPDVASQVQLDRKGLRVGVRMRPSPAESSVTHGDHKLLIWLSQGPCPKPLGPRTQAIPSAPPTILPSPGVSEHSAAVPAGPCRRSLLARFSGLRRLTRRSQHERTAVQLILPSWISSFCEDEDYAKAVHEGVMSSLNVLLDD